MESDEFNTSFQVQLMLVEGKLVGVNAVSHALGLFVDSTDLRFTANHCWLFESTRNFNRG